MITDRTGWRRSPITNLLLGYVWSPVLKWVCFFVVVVVVDQTKRFLLPWRIAALAQTKMADQISVYPRRPIMLCFSYLTTTFEKNFLQNFKISMNSNLSEFFSRVRKRFVWFSAIVWPKWRPSRSANSRWAEFSKIFENLNHFHTILLAIFWDLPLFSIIWKFQANPTKLSAIFRLFSTQVLCLAIWPKMANRHWNFTMFSNYF